MAKPVKPAARRGEQSGKSSKYHKKAILWNFPLNRKNLIYLAIGLGVILLGYLLMATGITEDTATPDGKWANIFAVQISPVILLIGYCIIIPIAILKFFPSQKDKEEQSK